MIYDDDDDDDDDIVNDTSHQSRHLALSQFGCISPFNSAEFVSSEMTG